jgi:hypothetical protein
MVRRRVKRGVVSTADVEIWGWSGCPSHEKALEQVARALSDLGHEATPIGLRWIETNDEAVRLHFVGSPTIAVDGRDVLPGPADEPASLTCRVYRRRDGRVSPLPDPDDLLDALRQRLPGASLTERTRP